MVGFCDLNLKFPLILAISVLMSSLNFMLSRDEHEKFLVLPVNEVLFPSEHVRVTLVKVKCFRRPGTLV